MATTNGASTQTPSGASQRRSFSERQLAQSSWKPNHFTCYRYPCFDLLTTEEQVQMEVVLPDIHNASNRFEPGPMLPNLTVAVNSGWHGVESSRIFTICPAEEYNPFRIQWRSEGTSAIHKFEEEYTRATSFVGESNITAVTFKRSSAGDERVWLRLKKTTTWYKPHEADIVVDAYSTTFPLEAFTANGGLGSDWWLSIDNLLFRRTDIAARYVNHRMKLAEAVDDTVDQWKAARQILYANEIPQISAGEVVPQCHICRLDSTDTVTLPCGGGKHVFCKCCIEAWCNSKTPETADCPTCRQVIVSDKARVHDLTYGLEAGVYKNDARYSIFENFQRSCGDLDARLASNTPNKFIIRIERLMECWDIIVAGAELEPAESTPHHLQPARYPEFSIVRRRLVFDIRSTIRDESVCEIDSLASWIVKNLIFRSFDDEIRANGLHRYLDAKQTNQPWAEYIRYNLESFLHRTVSRTLMMFWLRRCEEHGPGWHWHGDRQYYSTRPALKRKLESSPEDETDAENVLLPKRKAPRDE